MAEDLALYEVTDRVAVITLNRPERLNAWTGELGKAYYDRLDQAVADPGVGAIVVTGAGRGFCAGADMSMLQGVAGGAGGNRGSTFEPDVRPMHHPLTVPKLTVAAVNGAAAGLGLVQALYLDVRFVADEAKLTSAFPQRGLIAEYGSAWLLSRLVGTGRAMDILASSRIIKGQEAAQMGLANRSLPAEQVLAAAVEYASAVAKLNSPASVAAIKAQIAMASSQTLDEALGLASALMAVSLRGADMKEGVSSFVERRPASFSPLGEGTDFSGVLGA